MKTQILRGLVTVCVSISIAAGLNGCGSEKEKTDQIQMSGTMETPKANSLEESGREPRENAGASGSALSEAEEPASETAPAQKSFTSFKVTPLKKTVYAVKGVNIRSGAGTDYKILDGAFAGDVLEQTGICDNGWIEISWRGVKAYVDGEYVSDTPPASWETASGQKETFSKVFDRIILQA